MGGQISIIHKAYKIIGADKFTRDYFLNAMQRDMPLYVPKVVQKETKRKTEIPPHNGFGDEEDSKVNCLRLIPKPPKKDCSKVLTEETKLSFAIQFFNPKIEDRDRRLVLTYYLNEKQLMIFEPQIKNSGFRCGKFLEKGKYKNLKSKLFVFVSELLTGVVV